tara:strand:- start:3356 stop:3784 length:429 start_codon:yes stop_codon:yes gene_type:complete
MRITVDSFEEQPDGSVLVEFTDAGQGFTAFFHITEQAVEDLIVQQLNPNGAPTELMESCLSACHHHEHDAEEIVNSWAAAYSELVQDRLDRKAFGMKAVTSNGHEDLVAARDGAEVDAHNLDGKVMTAMDDFINGRPESGKP